jgi:type IV secretory pathway VirD2 relaxase
VRLAHKLVFSMPPGTNPDKVLSAVQTLCREEFALKHRYVMALHTDSSHPHVHVVLKAKSEQGSRLNIHKATLKEWREKFAQHLRAQGVVADATPRHVRGQTVRSTPHALLCQQARERPAPVPPKRERTLERTR